MLSSLTGFGPADSPFFSTIATDPGCLSSEEEHKESIISPYSLQGKKAESKVVVMSQEAQKVASPEECIVQSLVKGDTRA